MSDEKPLPTDPNSDPKGGDGQGAGNSPGLKEALEKTLGKQFADEATALKAVKDTFDYVGKAGKFSQAVKVVMDSKGLSEEQAVEYIKTTVQTQPQQIDTSKFVAKEELDQRDFFLDNPDLKPYKDLVMTFKKANPEKSLSEIIQMTEFKSVYDKAKATDDNQKSIVHSNPKLGISKDKMTKAAEASKSGNIGEAEKLAVEAVMDAHEGL